MNNKDPQNGANNSIGGGKNLAALRSPQNMDGEVCDMEVRDQNVAKVRPDLIHSQIHRRSLASRRGRPGLDHHSQLLIFSF